MKMTRARIVVLAVALACGVGAIWLVNKLQPPEVVVQAPPPSVPTDAVLVAAKELHRDDILDADSMRWEPKDKIPGGFIWKSAEPDAIDARKGWTVIENIYKDDFLRPERISKDPRSGLLSSLHAGMRAMSINIDAQGSSTAGGFILPNHYVDVIHIFKDEHFIRMFPNEKYSERVEGNPFGSQVIARNVRVLAIGQKEQLNPTERAITGVNATLEVTPDQAETILIAQRTGSLILTLRSMSDANTAGAEKEHPAGDLKIGRGGGAPQDKVN